jgi:cobalt-zinc-cadmium efflux system membrane fusion protein
LLSRIAVSRNWTIRTVGLPPIEAKIDEVSYILDPNQHTAVVKGYIDNAAHKMRAGQFVTASVALPAPDGVVEVPLTALAEDGRQSIVFVQPDPEQARYTLRRVVVASRFETTAFVKSRLTPEEAKLTPQEAELGLYQPEPLRPSERVIISGALELRAALEDKESQEREKR